MSDKINSHSDILLPALRQYRRTCDETLIPAYHQKKTTIIVASLLDEIATLKAEREANQLVMTSDTIHIIDLETRLINSNKACDDWREQAQRNDTPVKSAAEIGRDAILSAARKLYFKNRGSSHASDDYHDLERYANDLTNNTGA